MLHTRSVPRPSGPTKVLRPLALLPLLAAAPENADPTLAPWFQALRQPDTGMSCCDVADCRPVDSKVVGDHYEAWIEGNWVPVPPGRILERTDNPVGRAVICWTPQRGVMCFIRESQT